MSHRLYDWALCLGAAAALAPRFAAGCSDPLAPLLVVVEDHPKALYKPSPRSDQDFDNEKYAAALHAALPNLDRTQLATDALRCVGVPDPAAAGCRSATASSDAPTLLNAQPDHCGWGALVSLSLWPATFVARVDFFEMEMKNGKLAQNETYSVAYVSRAPEEIAAGARKHREQVAAYWREGTPSRLETEVIAAFADLPQLLDTLIAGSKEKGADFAAWPLPNLTTAAKDRYHCGGIWVCKDLKLLREEAERSWIVGKAMGRTRGAVSMNRSASAEEASITWILNAAMPNF